jgi:hypothetical protein
MNNYIVVLGGWKKSGKTGYVAKYIQYYSPELNVFQIGRGLLPTGVFRGASYHCESGVCYISCETKRDSNSYGPNLPHILTADCLKNRFEVTNFMES